MAQTGAEFLIQQGMQQGIQQGQAEAMHRTIINLLQIRFQTVSDQISEKVKKITDLPKLDSIFEQVATAQTVDEIKFD